MAYDFNGTNQRIHTASTPVTAAPLTIAMWAYPDSVALGFAVSVGDSGGSNRFVIAMVGGSLIAACTGSAGATAPISSGAWAHCAGVFTSSTSRTAFKNGAAGVADTSSAAPTGVNSINIGARIDTGAPGGYYDGRLADVGIWDAALTADEIASLAKGFSPRLIRPQSLVFYAPLIRDLIDVRGGLALTNANTAAVADHPRIYA